MGERLEPKTIRLSPTMWAALEALAAHEKRSISNLIEVLLARALTEQPEHG